jgi:hypothetical protein
MFECSDMLYPYCKSGRCHMIIYQGTNHQTKVNYLITYLRLFILLLASVITDKVQQFALKR